MSVAKQISLFANGYNLACALQSFEPLSEREVLDATVLCMNDREYEKGFLNGMLTASGIWKHDGTLLDQIHNVMSAAFGDSRTLVITGSFGLITAGEAAFLMNAFSNKYSIATPLGELITVDLACQSNNGVQDGLWLFSALVVAGTTNGTVVDNGAASANGGLLHIQLKNTTATSVIGVLQHSTTGVGAWVDLVTINDVLGVKAVGEYTIGVNFADTNTILFNGVTYTAKTTPVGATDFQIGSGAAGSDTNLGISIFNLVTMLNASANPANTVATYSDNHTASNKNATKIIVTYDVPGTAGNAFSLGTNTGNIVRSGATLAGGEGGETHRAKSYTIAPLTTINRYTRFVPTVAGGDTELISAALVRS